MKKIITFLLYVAATEKIFTCEQAIAQSLTALPSVLPWRVTRLILGYALQKKWIYQRTLEEDSSRHEIQRRHLTPSIEKPIRAFSHAGIITLIAACYPNKILSTIYYSDFVEELTFSPDLSLLAWHKVSVGARTILHTTVWNIGKYKEVLRIPESGYPSFFPNGTSILVVNKKNESVDIWDLTTCKRTNQLTDKKRIKSIEWARVKSHDEIIVIAVEKGLWPIDLGGRVLDLWRDVLSI